jgi:protein ImuA
MTVPERALRALRRSIAVLETAGARAIREPKTAPFAGLDHAGLDHALGGGIVRGAVHEVFAATAPDGAAARGFAALLALRAASPGRPLLWLSEDALLREIGEPNAEGLADMGLAPDAALLVRARDGLASLRGAVEAARCAGLGAVLVESWGAAKGSTLTASRRLTLAAKESGVTIVLARTGAAPAPSAAETRWLVAAARSRAFAANAPGLATFALTLLRHRHGAPGGPWLMEWTRDECLFRSAPLPRDLSSQPRDRPAAPRREQRVLRLAG